MLRFWGVGNFFVEGCVGKEGKEQKLQDLIDKIVGATQRSE